MPVFIANRQWVAVLLAVFMAFALSACGGGSSTRTAAPDPEPMPMPPTAEEIAAQRTSVQMAINAATAALAGITGTSSDEDLANVATLVTAATTALTEATDLPDGEATAFGVNIASLNTGLVNARNSVVAARAAAAEEEERRKEMAAAAQKAKSATAKALKAAIDIAKQDGGGTVNVTAPTAIPALDLDGTGSETAVSTALTLKKADGYVAALGSWKGADYAGSESGTKNTGMVRAYSNAEAASSLPFVGEAGEAVHGLTQATADDGKDVYTAPTTADKEIAGASFPTTGTQTYEGDKRKFSGTYMGASGSYQCPSTVAANGCTANATATGIVLVGGWTFTPIPGAMLQEKDAAYLQFGWWVRKDKDGPSHAGAFYRASGATLVDESTINTAALVGKATYAGHAAGKFAISDSIDPANDNSGHFTAAAELTADFKETGSSLSGTIDNFRLNDGTTDPGWSVALQKASLQGTGTAAKFATDADAATADRTVWSIGENKAAASGSWEAAMYNDKKSDGNNTPDSLVGSFMSGIGTTHSMVGAFGAERQ